MLNSKQVEDTLEKSIAYLRKRYGIERVGYYGSYARGEQTKNSDVDIVIEAIRDLSFGEVLRIQEYFKRKLKVKVGLLEKKDIKKNYKKYIIPYIIYTGDSEKQKEKKKKKMKKKTHIPYLEDMVEYLGETKKYVTNIEYKDFEKDKQKINAVLHVIQIVGEAARKIPEEIREKYSDIEWKKIVNMRNRIVHGYGGIDLKTVYDIAKNEVPGELKKIREVLKNEKRLIE
ncbi:MAG: DUF86 domain-containing protein [Cytophagales bacterium]|nr:DUF86 domain-containing protein [Cytophagales bacterium]